MIVMWCGNFLVFLLLFYSSIVLAPPAELAPKDVAAQEYKKYEENSKELARKREEQRAVQDEFAKKRAELEAAKRGSDLTKITTLTTEFNAVEQNLTVLDQAVAKLEQNNTQLEEAYKAAVTTDLKAASAGSYIPSLEATTNFEQQLKTSTKEYYTEKFSKVELERLKDSFAAARDTFQQMANEGVVYKNGQRSVLEKEGKIDAVQKLNSALSHLSSIEKALKQKEGSSVAQPDTTTDASRAFESVKKFFKSVSLQLKSFFSRTAKLQLAQLRLETLSKNLTQFARDIKAKSAEEMVAEYRRLKSTLNRTPSEEAKFQQYTQYYAEVGNFMTTLDPFIKESLARIVLEAAQKNDSSFSLAVTQLEFEKALQDFAGLSEASLQQDFYKSFFNEDDPFTLLGMGARDWRESNAGSFKALAEKETDPVRKKVIIELISNFDQYRVRRLFVETVLQEILQPVNRLFLAQFMSDLTAKAKYVDDLKNAPLASTASTFFSKVPQFKPEIATSPELSSARTLFENGLAQERAILTAADQGKSFNEFNKTINEKTIPDADVDPEGHIAAMKKAGEFKASFLKTGLAQLVVDVADAFFSSSAPEPLKKIVADARLSRGVFDSVKITAYVENNKADLYSALHKRLFGNEIIYAKLGIPFEQWSNTTMKDLQVAFGKLNSETQKTVKPLLDDYSANKVMYDQQFFLGTLLIADRMLIGERLNNELIPALNKRL